MALPQLVNSMCPKSALSEERDNAITFADPPKVQPLTGAGLPLTPQHYAIQRVDDIRVGGRARKPICALTHRRRRARITTVGYPAVNEGHPAVKLCVGHATA